MFLLNSSLYMYYDIYYILMVLTTDKMSNVRIRRPYLERPIFTSSQYELLRFTHQWFVPIFSVRICYCHFKLALLHLSDFRVTNLSPTGRSRTGA